MGLCWFKCLEQCQQAGNNELVKGEIWGALLCVCLVTMFSSPVLPKEQLLDLGSSTGLCYLLLTACALFRILCWGL